MIWFIKSEVIMNRLSGKEIEMVVFSRDEKLRLDGKVPPNNA